MVLSKWVLRHSEYHKKGVETNCVYMCDDAMFPKLKISFFLVISRNPPGFVSLCPDFAGMALGRPAHGLQALLDVGPLCRFQQPAGKLSSRVLAARTHAGEHVAWGSSGQESSVHT